MHGKASAANGRGARREGLMTLEERRAVGHECARLDRHYASLAGGHDRKGVVDLYTDDGVMTRLFFHNMDELFETRSVTRAGAVTEFPRPRRSRRQASHSTARLSLTKSSPTRTFTNAFLIICDGRIIGIAIDKVAIESVDDLAVDNGCATRSQ